MRGFLRLVRTMMDRLFFSRTCGNRDTFSRFPPPARRDSDTPDGRRQGLGSGRHCSRHPPPPPV